jgi:hypothetical protein
MTKHIDQLSNPDGSLLFRELKHRVRNELSFAICAIILFGSVRQISEGFTIALRAMGFEAVPSDIAQSDTTSNPEER